MRNYECSRELHEIVLDALGLTAAGTTSTNELFEELGLVVRPVRQGRSGGAQRLWEGR